VNICTEIDDCISKHDKLSETIIAKFEKCLDAYIKKTNFECRCTIWSNPNP
jgi:hypothetical protein